MRILIIDGQGGRLGALLVSACKARQPACELICVGTNSIATAAMLKAGANAAATGEHPVLVQAAKAHVIMGPIGIVLADALWGEVTPAMAAAVAGADAKKILIPVNKCNTLIAGVQPLTMQEYVDKAIALL